MKRSLLRVQDLGWPQEWAPKKEVTTSSPPCPPPNMQNPLAQAKVRTGLVSSLYSSNPLLLGQNSWSRKLGVISIWREKLPPHRDTSQLLFKIPHQIYKIHVHIVSQPDLKKNVLYYPAFCQLQFHTLSLPHLPSGHHLKPFQRLGGY